MKSEDEPENDARLSRKSGIAYGAAISLFAAVASFMAVGWVLDRWLGTKPWLLVAGIVLGSAAGFYQFVRATSRLS